MFRQFGFLGRIAGFGIVFEGEGGPGSTPPAAPAAPWAGAEGVWSVGEGDTAQPWHATIAEPEVRAHLEAKGYANPSELAIANHNLTKLQRGDPTVIGLPGKDATPEQMGEFYGKLGRPDAPDGYELTFDDGVQVDEGMLTFGKTAFHAAGLSPAQAQSISNSWNEYVATESARLAEEDAKANAKELTDLETSWGADLNKNKEAGRRAVEALGVKPELVQKLEQNIGSASVVELLATIGLKSAEGGFTGGDAGGGDPDNPSNMTSEQAQAKINELKADAKFSEAFNTRNHPEHQDAVDRMAALFARV